MRTRNGMCLSIPLQDAARKGHLAKSRHRQALLGKYHQPYFRWRLVSASAPKQSKIPEEGSGIEATVPLSAKPSIL